MYFNKNLQIEDLENEEWIDAIGFDGIYQVSNLGRVKTLGRWVRNGSKKCEEKKEIQRFEFGRNTCLVCRAISKKENYLKKRKPSK